MTQVHYLEDADASSGRLPFSAAARVGDWIFVSGQAATNADGAVVIGEFEQEMRRSIENLRVILERFGSCLADVIQTRNYIKHPMDLPRFNELYREYFRPPYPVRTTLTGCLNSVKFELDAVAFIRNARPT
jgi:2-iminobutanoate/2-iminopropanoate deaminase